MWRPLAGPAPTRQVKRSADGRWKAAVVATASAPLGNKGEAPRCVSVVSVCCCAFPAARWYTGCTSWGWRTTLALHSTVFGYIVIIYTVSGFIIIYTVSGFIIIKYTVYWLHELGLANHASVT